MRLGAYDCVLKPGTLAHKIYKTHKAFKDEKANMISERHRHRYEFNNDYREQLEKAGFVISGTSPDDFFVEMIELLRISIRSLSRLKHILNISLDRSIHTRCL
jgi:CTP synthase